MWRVADGSGAAVRAGLDGMFEMLYVMRMAHPGEDHRSGCEFCEGVSEALAAAAGGLWDELMEFEPYEACEPDDCDQCLGFLEGRDAVAGFLASQGVDIWEEEEG